MYPNGKTARASERLMMVREFFAPDSPGVCVTRRRYDVPSEISHDHEFFELVVVLEGAGLHCIHGEQYVLAPGDVFLVRPGTIHTYTRMDGFVIANFLYLPEFFRLNTLDFVNTRGAALLFSAGEVKSKLAPAELRKVVSFLDDMETEQKQKQSGWRFSVVAIFMRLLILIARNVAEDVCYPREDAIAGLIQFQLKKRRSPLSIAQMTEFTGWSKRTLLRRFQLATGMAPAACLAELRLQCAARELIASPELPIADIAKNCGFHDVNYFFRRFRARFNTTPETYRKQFSF